MPTTDPKLLELLVCPLTKQLLEYDQPQQTLTSRAAHLVFPITNGVPLMLAEEAHTLTADAKRK